MSDFGKQDQLQEVISELSHDRRRFKRFPAHIDIKYRKLSHSRQLDNLLQTGHVTNLSQEGVFISTNENLAKGLILELSFFVRPQGRVIHVLARVIGNSAIHSSPGVGVEILKTSRIDFLDIVNHTRHSEWHHLSSSLSAPKNPSSHNRSIVVIDDSKDFREMIACNLQQLGYDVIEADSGAMALDILESHQPEIILLDILMPGLNGYATFDRIRERETLDHIPIIFMTCLDGDVDILKGLLRGCDGYVTKPFSHDLLEKEIHRVLNVIQNGN